MYLKFLAFCFYGFLSAQRSSYGGRSEMEDKCVLNSINCTEHRLRNHVGVKEVLPIFQDALYHYCLDLMGCDEGREQICHNVGNSEQDYPNPDLRRRLVEQCDKWKIPIKLARKGDMTAHYVFSLAARQANSSTT